METKELLPYFFVGWVGVTVLGWWWVSSRKIPAQKRLALRVMAVVAAIVFGTFVAMTAKPSMSLVAMVGILIVITYSNVKLVKVCNTCCAISRPQGLAPPAHCYKCGAILTP